MKFFSGLIKGALAGVLIISAAFCGKNVANYPLVQALEHAYTSPNKPFSGTNHVPDDSVEAMENLEHGTIVRVVDGDTLVVSVINGDDAGIRVRLIGVDTPESVNPDAAKNTDDGKVASNFTKSLLPKGTDVWLEYDVSAKDKYDRYLAYVYFMDEKGNPVMLNRYLLQEGMAQTMTVPPNVKYRDVFAEDYHTARENGVGLWAE